MFGIMPQTVRLPLTDTENGPVVSLTFEVDAADTSKVRLLVTGGTPDDPVWAIPFNRNGMQSGPVERRPSPAEAEAKAAKERSTKVEN